MPAPDLPPVAPHAVERPLAVHLHPRLVDPGALAGGIAIVIDNLRASVTITAAITHGARGVVPVLTVDDARSARERLISDGMPATDILLGGERGGVLIPGFDLDNSPGSCTRERVAGKTIVFTTSNGTAALLHARLAPVVLVGCLANLGAASEFVKSDPRPVNILCAGTRDEISLDDVIPAGAFVERLSAAGRAIVSDDSARVALHAYRGASSSPGGIAEALRSSRGGRNLDRQGLGADIEFCAGVDVLGVVPRYDARSGRITGGASL